MVGREVNCALYLRLVVGNSHALSVQSPDAWCFLVSDSLWVRSGGGSSGRNQLSWYAFTVSERYEFLLVVLNCMAI